MKVHELITKLQNCNPDAKVIVYCWEDQNDAEDVYLKAVNPSYNEKLYCKGYSFEEYEKAHPDQDYVVIGD